MHRNVFIAAALLVAAACGPRDHAGTPADSAAPGLDARRSLAVADTAPDSAEVCTSKFRKGRPVGQPSCTWIAVKPDTVIVQPGPIPDTTTPPAPVVLRPLPWGMFHANMRNVNCGGSLNYTGTMKWMEGSNWKSVLDSARACKAQIFVGLTTRRGQFRMKSDTTKLDTKHWIAFVVDTVWRARAPAMQSYFDDGTILGVYLIDEYNCVACWSGMKILDAQVDTLAGAVKGLFGRRWPVAVRVDPSKLVRWPWRHIDLTWAQFSGIDHYPSACGGCGGRWVRTRGVALLTSAADTARVSVDSMYYLYGKVFADSFAKAAKAINLGLVLGVNTPNGGQGYSKVVGSEGAGSWVMAPGEYSGFNRALVQQPYACAVMHWKASTSWGVNEMGSWTAAQKAAMLGFDTLKTVRDANVVLRAIAAKRSAGPCLFRP